MTSSLSKYEGKSPSPFNFFIQGHFHSILFYGLLPLLFAFTISHDCIFLRNEEADLLKEEEEPSLPIMR